MMKMEQIGKSYGDKAILRAVNLDIAPGKFTAFIGPNGAGKSTLLSIMSRLLVKDEGILLIKGQEIEAWHSAALAKELTMLKQQIHFQVKFTVEELVAFGRFPYSQGRLTPEDRIKIDEALTYMDLQDFRHRLIDTLSGGQLQRVYIAMVLAQDTDIVLLDEPLNNLDIKQGISMMKTLRRLVAELEKTVVIVVHDINIASQFVDQMVCFKEGEIYCRGTPQEVMTEEVLSGLYDMNVIVDDIRGKRICIYQ